MKATELKTILTSLTKANVPVFLWGAPGIGKSSIVKQIAQEQNIKCIDLRLSLMDPTDLKGIPFYDKDSHTALWAPPAFLPQEGMGILFLDELNSAPPSVQASAYQLILDRAVGEYVLPAGWSIVAAGNREMDRGVTYKMAAPLANRFVHFEMDVSVEDWRLWAYQNCIDTRIISYISLKPEHLFMFDPKSDAKSFATPRSWSYVDTIIKTDLESTLLLDTISAAIGEDVAVSFLSFTKVASKLPNIEEILSSGSGKYSEEMDVLYILSTALVSGYLKEATPQKLENILNYILELQPEFSVMVVQDLQRNEVRTEHAKNFDKWVQKFSYLLA